MEDPKDFLKEREEARNKYTLDEQRHFANLDGPYESILSALKNFPEAGDNYQLQPDKCGNFVICIDGKRRTLRFVDNHYNDNYSWRSGREPAEFLRNDPQQRHLGHTFKETVIDHVAAPRYKSDRYHPACIFELEIVSAAALKTMSIAYTDDKKTHIAVTRADRPAAEHKFKNNDQMLAYVKTQIQAENPPVMIPDFERSSVITPSVTVYPVTDTDKIASEIASWVTAMVVKPLTPLYILRQLEKDNEQSTNATLSEHFDAVAQAGKIKANNAFETVLRQNLSDYALGLSPENRTRLDAQTGIAPQTANGVDAFIKKILVP